MLLKKEKIVIIYYGEECELIISEEKYLNDRVCILLTTITGEPFCKLTVNIDEEKIDDNQFFIKNIYPENYIAEQLEKEGLIKRAGRTVGCNYHNNYATLWEIV